MTIDQILRKGEEREAELKAKDVEDKKKAREEELLKLKAQEEELQRKREERKKQVIYSFVFHSSNQWLFELIHNPARGLKEEHR